MTAALWQRMDATERFAADVAHEIKNPLSSVRSAIETAVRISDPEKRQQLLLLVLDDIERLTRLINDISDASRLDAELSRSTAEKVHVWRLLEALAEVDEATRPGTVAPHIMLERSGPPNSAPDLTVLGHEDRLVQVFRNILANAASFSPPHGLIRIAASRQSGYVVVGIEDEGPGIPPGKLEAIFDAVLFRAAGKARNSAPIPASACRSRSRSSRATTAPSMPKIASMPPARWWAPASSSACPRPDPSR